LSVKGHSLFKISSIFKSTGAYWITAAFAFIRKCGKQKAALLLDTESGSLVYYLSLAFLAKQEGGTMRDLPRSEHG